MRMSPVYVQFTWSLQHNLYITIHLFSLPFCNSITNASVSKCQSVRIIFLKALQRNKMQLHQAGKPFNEKKNRKQPCQIFTYLYDQIYTRYRPVNRFGTTKVLSAHFVRDVYLNVHSQGSEVVSALAHVFLQHKQDLFTWSPMLYSLYKLACHINEQLYQNMQIFSFALNNTSL